MRCYRLKTVHYKWKIMFTVIYCLKIIHIDSRPNSMSKSTSDGRACEGDGPPPQSRSFEELSMKIHLSVFSVE